MQALLNDVLKEMKLRNKIMRQKKITSFEKYYALNLWNTIKLNYSFLLIDDIWNLVSAKPQSLSISLFRIILNGPGVGIHTILGSNISYRNLLQQLIELNPAIEKMLQENTASLLPLK
jgi:DNA segregation ATPase FtsK/SpoIIIE-like protein